MAATLDDVVQIMKTQTHEQENTSSAINDLASLFKKQFLKEERGAGDRLEAARERRPSRGADLGTAITIPGLDALNSSVNSLVMMGANLAKLILGISAGVAAVIAAFSGLRGWELKAVANIGRLGTAIDNLFPETITGTISKAIENLRLGILRRVFGIGPDGKMIRGVDGRFAGKLSVADAVTEAMTAFRTRVLNMFGIGADGKLIAVKGADGKFAPPRLGRVIIQLRSLFRPVTVFSEAMGKFFKSTFFKNITDFIGSAGGGVLKAINKILWPIGFLFSVYDGITAYIESDADGFIARLGAGMGGFFGSFIGAPFDLLKKGISWLMTNLLGFDEDSPFMKKINEFSFEESIGQIVSGIFNMVQAGVDWIRDFFSDPAGTLGFDKFSTAATDLFQSFVLKFQQLDAVISTEFEYQLTRLVNSFKNSFDRVITFVRNLGDELYLIIAKNLRFKLDPIVVRDPIFNEPLFTIPGFDVGVGNAQTISAAEERIDTRNTRMFNRITARNDNTAAALLSSQEALAAFTGSAPVVINQDNRTTNNNSTSDRRTYVATGAATDGFSLTQSVQ